MSISIRRGSFEDVEGICSLLFGLKSMYGSSPETDLDSFRQRYEPGIRLALGNASNAVWIAVDSANGIVGFISTTIRIVIRLGGPVGTVEEVFVRSDCRRSGIGMALWSAASSELRTRGVEVVEWVSSLAHPGQRQYADKIGLEWYSNIHRVGLR